MHLKALIAHQPSRRFHHYPRCILPGLFLALSLTQIVGCGYPQVTPGACEVAESLDQVFAAKNTKQLDIANELVATWQQEGKITATEKAWFDDWVERARGGDWEGAMRESRRLLKDQTDW